MGIGGKRGRVPKGAVDQTAKAAELYQQGLTLAEVSGRVGLSERTLRRGLEKLGVEMRQRGRRTMQHRGAAARAASVEGSSTPAPPIDPPPLPTPPDAMSDDPAEGIRARLTQVRAALDLYAPRLTVDVKASEFSSLSKIEIELTESLARMVPPEPPRPEDDPTNQEAERVLSARIRQMVADAEKLVKCVHCGKSPYA